MQEVQITKQEEGQRLDKFLGKYLNEAPKSFLYKMLRKKNIVLNKKKADGREKLKSGDKVQFFLADETIEKFSSVKVQRIKPVKLNIIYEDKDVLIVNKPAGMLSQKSAPQDVSLNEYVITYLLESGQITEEMLRTFRPSICNRLDRNTSGLIAAGKSMAGLQQMGKLFHDRGMKKYYRCLVKGVVDREEHVEGFLWKDEKNNQVYVSREEKEGAKRIETTYTPLWTADEVTFLEVHLITGRTHQIRAHLASKGHPIVGDGKYGDAEVNTKYKKKYGLTHQFLHAYRMEMPKMEGELSNLSQKTFTAVLPKELENICKEIRR